MIGMAPIGGPSRAAAFVRPSFAHQNSASMFGGQMVSPPHPNAAGAVTSSTSSAAASLYDKPPASPMDTSDNNISSHSISSTIAGTTFSYYCDDMGVK